MVLQNDYRENSGGFKLTHAVVWQGQSGLRWRLGTSQYKIPRSPWSLSEIICGRSERSKALRGNAASGGPTQYARRVRSIAARRHCLPHTFYCTCVY